MCLILAAYEYVPPYRLIIAANRDEYYARPTAGASFWEDCPDILAGRDLMQRGTWLGLTKSGRWGAVTNYRDPREFRPEAKSRGELVSRYLRAEQEASAYLLQVQAEESLYNGFNLLLGGPDSLWYYGSRGDGIRKLPPGLYGLSNHLLDTPWDKVEKAKAKLREALRESHKLNFEDIFAFLADTGAAPDDQLPDTGVGLEKERFLSSIFIAGADYGTRSSCIITVDRNNRVVLAERSYGPGNMQKYEDRMFQFKIL